MTNMTNTTNTTSHASKTATKTNDTKARRLAAAAEAVRKALGLETLEDRGRDGLDFHDIPVAAIRDAIAIAFEAGWDAGFDAARTRRK